MSNLMTDKQRRAVYDVTRSTSYHDTSKLPGKTHHVPGMHEGIEVFLLLTNSHRLETQARKIEP